MVKLKLEDIWKGYGKEIYLRGVNLEVENGELMVLLGPSGVGKTTTLKIIAGLITPDRGRIFFNNKDVTSLPAEKRNIGFVFQSLALFPHMTVWDNIAFGLEARGWSYNKIEKRVNELIELFQLNGLENRFPRELSGGQQQRVAIARALAPNPSILLLDEPFANLDALLRDRMRWELRKIQKVTGVTTIFVTHDQEEAFQIADRVAIMLDGRIVQVGKPIEVYENPANERIADFLGINVIEAEKASEFLKINCSENKKYVLIWPEEIEIDKEGISAVVRSIALLKSHTRALLEINNNIELEAFFDPEIKISVGKQIRVKIRKFKMV